MFVEDINVKNALKQWKHVFKLDPAKEISDRHIKAICHSGTDAVIIGGTDNITLDGILDLYYRVRRYAVPCILEVSTLDSVIPGFDHYFIPMVLNSTEKKWAMDIQHEAIKMYSNFMNWDEITVEGYCILNPDAKAFKKTRCMMPEIEDVVAYAHMAEHIFNLPIFYVEYSGTYGEPNLVKKVKASLQHTVLFYGGGIKNAEQAREMKQYADVIVVGNSVYTDFEAALDTVKAVKDV